MAVYDAMLVSVSFYEVSESGYILLESQTPFQLRKIARMCKKKKIVMDVRLMNRHNVDSEHTVLTSLIIEMIYERKKKWWMVMTQNSTYLLQTC